MLETFLKRFTYMAIALVLACTCGSRLALSLTGAVSPASAPAYAAEDLKPESAGPEDLQTAPEDLVTDQQKQDIEREKEKSKATATPVATPTVEVPANAATGPGNATSTSPVSTTAPTIIAVQPEDLIIDTTAAPPGADKLMRSARKPTVFYIEPTAVAAATPTVTAPVATASQIAPPATSAIATAATASTSPGTPLAATGSVPVFSSTPSVAVAATAPVQAAFATSAVASGTSTTEPALVITTEPAATSTVTSATSTQPLPPGAVVVSSEPGKQTPRRKDIYPYGTVELISNNFSVSGDEVGFLNQNGLLFNTQKLTQRVQLGMDGQLDNGMKLTGEFLDVPYMDNVFKLSVADQKSYADFGDVRADFVSGDMTAFTKNIRGISAGHTFGKTSVRTVFSNEKSKTQSETFNGRNIRGPYVLRSNDILPNTEVVRVNGRSVARSEYSMDYFLGQITFNNTLDPSDTIEVHYESALWVSMHTGNLSGVSVTSKMLGDKATGGISLLSEKSTVPSQAEVVNAVKSATRDEILDSAKGSGVLDLGQIRLEKNHEIVTADTASGTVYLSHPEDYSIDYAGGIVTFATGTAKFNSFASATVLTVVFNYYKPGALHFVQNEELSGDNQIEYKLQNDGVYGGTEKVFLYQNGNLVRSLAAGTDYQIVEGNNTIVFLDSSISPSSTYGRTVRISYEIVPEEARVASETGSTRTVESMFGNVKLGKVALGGEFARSTSDVRLKSVQVLEELVATVTDPHRRIYLLQREAVYNSVTVYFDDPSAPSALQRSGTDYIEERDSSTGVPRTRLNFKADIPAGTTIIANYSYMPTAPSLNGVQGVAGRVTADGTLGGMAMRGEVMRKSTLFAPLTAYNDLETERLLFDLGKNTPKYSVNVDYAHHANDAAFDSTDQLKLDRLTTRLGYNIRKNTTAALTLENQTRADNRAVNLVKNGLSGRKLELSYVSNKSYKSTFTFESRTFRDDTSQTSDRDTSRYGTSFDYYPGDKFKINLAFDNSSIRSTPPAFTGLENFSINNFSTRIKSTYVPDKTLTLNVALDTQNITDSRENVLHGRLDSIHADLFGKPHISLLNDYTFSFYREDRPDPVYGDSRTDVATIRATVRAAVAVNMVPSFIITKVNIGTGTQSNDNTVGLRAEYRAGSTTGLRSAVGYTTSSRSGTNTPMDSPGAATHYTSKQSQTSLNVDYTPGVRIVCSGIFQITNTATGDTSQTRNNYTAAVDYILNTITTLRLLFNLDSNKPSPGDLTTWQLGMKRKIDKNLDFNLDYKNQKLAGASNTTGFSGNMLTMKMLATF